MDAGLDRAINHVADELARFCLVPSAAGSTARIQRELFTALRLLDGVTAGGKLVDRERVHWLLEQVTLRLLRRVESRVAKSPKLTLNDEGKAALRSAFAESFDEVMRSLEASLI
jgi:hypothetical protein